MEQQALVPTPATQWKGKIQLEGVDLPLPSTNVARVKQISPQAFITSGLIPDPLTAMVTKAIRERKGFKPDDMTKFAEDPKMFSSAMELFDRVLSYVMVEPRIFMPPPCDTALTRETKCGEYANVPIHEDKGLAGYHEYHEGPRDPEVLYADQVELDDKIFIFNWCLGGTRDLQKFRGELDERMAALSDGEDVPVPAF